jgi:hypothetical protein
VKKNTYEKRMTLSILKHESDTSDTQNIVRLRFRQYESQIRQPVNESEATLADWKEHTDHCIEYLRLSITCGDFLVVEPASPPETPPELTAGGLGWGVVHDCIDFNGLRKWQVGKRYEFEATLH